MANKGTIRLGIAGWVFAPWRGGMFYPEDLKQKEELHYASRHLGVIEINATFRALQKPPSFRKWAAETPEDFVFSIKGHQAITHFKRLKDVDTTVANFLASGPLALGLAARTVRLAAAAEPQIRTREVRGVLRAAAEDAGRGGRAREEARRAQGPAPHGRRASRRSGTRSRCATRALRCPSSSISAAPTTSRSSRPTPPSGRRWMRPPTSPMPGCRARRDRTTTSRPTSISGPSGIDALASGKPVPEAKLVAKAVDKPRDVFALFVSTDKEHAPQNAQAVMKRLGLSPSA